MDNQTRNDHLGKTAADVITGFRGTITGFCQYLSGCDQYLITPKCETTNKAAEGSWFDCNRLQLEVGPKPVQLDTSNAAGPDKPAPIR